MCGRYSDAFTEAAMLDLARLFGEHAYGSERAEVRPTDPALIVIPQAGGYAAVRARWGLIPRGSTAEEMRRYATFNARVEGLEGSRAFAGPFRETRGLGRAQEGRAVLPLSAWWEWPDVRGEKKRVQLARKDGRPLLAAALWSAGEDEDGQERYSCTLVTREARPELAEVHDRQPALLLSKDLDAWLHGPVPQARAAAMTSWPDGLIAAIAP